MNHFIKLNQPRQHVAIEPEYCAQGRIAEGAGQSATADCTDLRERHFFILRDTGYTMGASCACAWISSDGGELDFGLETRTRLAYWQRLRARSFMERLE